MSNSYNNTVLSWKSVKRVNSVAIKCIESQKKYLDMLDFVAKNKEAKKKFIEYCLSDDYSEAHSNRSNFLNALHELGLAYKHQKDTEDKLLQELEGIKKFSNKTGTETIMNLTINQVNARLKKLATYPLSESQREEFKAMSQYLDSSINQDETLRTAKDKIDYLIVHVSEVVHFLSLSITAVDADLDQGTAPTDQLNSHPLSASMQVSHTAKPSSFPILPKIFEGSGSFSIVGSSGDPSPGPSASSGHMSPFYDEAIELVGDENRSDPTLDAIVEGNGAPTETLPHHLPIQEEDDAMTKPLDAIPGEGLPWIISSPLSPEAKKLSSSSVDGVLNASRENISGAHLNEISSSSYIEKLSIILNRIGEQEQEHQKRISEIKNMIGNKAKSVKHEMQSKHMTEEEISYLLNILTTPNSNPFLKASSFLDENKFLKRIFNLKEVKDILNTRSSLTKKGKNTLIQNLKRTEIAEERVDEGCTEYVFKEAFLQLPASKVKKQPKPVELFRVKQVDTSKENINISLTVKQSKKAKTIIACQKMAKEAAKMETSTTKSRIYGCDTRPEDAVKIFLFAMAYGVKMEIDNPKAIDDACNRSFLKQTFMGGDKELFNIYKDFKGMSIEQLDQEVSTNEQSNGEKTGRFFEKKSKNRLLEGYSFESNYLKMTYRDMLISKLNAWSKNKCGEKFDFELKKHPKLSSEFGVRIENKA